jgi:hypothetical protein
MDLGLRIEYLWANGAKLLTILVNHPTASDHNSALNTQLLNTNFLPIGIEAMEVGRDMRGDQLSVEGARLIQG